MSLFGSVTQLLRQLKAGEQTALGKLLARFRPFLLAQASRSLKNAPRRCMDEEDVLQAVAWDFYRGFGEGRWQRLANRQDLVALLRQITECKAINQLKHELAVKRDARRLQEDVASGSLTESGHAESGLEQLARDRALPPAEKLLQEDLQQHFLRALDGLKDNLRPFAELHLADRSVKEIAAEMQCSERTVARKIALIRATWLRLLTEADADATPRPQG